jgi:hypothetical protein
LHALAAVDIHESLAILELISRDGRRYETGSMTERILSFYEPLADHYHLIFDDWSKAIERQGKILNPLPISQLHSQSLKILDCACGIGT